MMYIKKQAAFTLVELLVTIAVAILLLATGIPLMDRIIENNRATTEVNSLVAALNLARSEAVKRGVPGVVCAGDGSTPQGCSGNATDWTNGFVVFFDGDNNGLMAPSERIRNWDKLAPGTDVTASAAQVSFAGTGESAVENTDEWEIEYDHLPSSDNKRCIKLSPSGQISTEDGECS